MLQITLINPQSPIEQIREKTDKINPIGLNTYFNNNSKNYRWKK